VCVTDRELHVAKKALGPTTNLYPMPALLLAVRTGEDSANILTIAWAGIVGNGPALLALRIGGFHYSTPFIDREMSFTVNVPSSSQAVGVDYCGMVSGQQDPDKAATCGWTLLPATQIASPLIADCPLNFECRVVYKHPIGRGAIYIAEILETHVDEDLLDEAGDIDAALLDPLIFTPERNYYRLGDKIGRAWELGRALQTEPGEE
jgi:flavin reductase (DIM6/NTAB) family NADH-FMN oxidoreductase RutF